MSERKVGKITNILSKFDVVINVGAEQGIVKGTKFEILGHQFPIKDEETDEELATVFHIKGKIVIKTVNEKFSIAEGYQDVEQKTLPFPSFSAERTSRVPLNIDEKDIPEIERKIKVGDTIR